MSTASKKTQVVILAGGQGKRMNTTLPKVLVEMASRPLLAYVLQAIKESGIDPDPVVVVGYQKDLVIQYLNGKYQTIWQPVQRGTGHAVRCCRSLLEGTCDSVLVLYGDMPFIRPRTIKRLLDAHHGGGSVLTMATITVEDFTGWRANLASYGRVLRDGSDAVTDIREVRDATPEIRDGREVNPSYFCFQAVWIWQALERLTPANAQGELYLTDLVHFAVADGHKVATIPADAQEGIGVNSQEDFFRAVTLLNAGS